MQQIGGICFACSRKILRTSEHHILAGIPPEGVSGRAFVTSLLGDSCLILVMLCCCIKTMFCCTSWSYQWLNKSSLILWFSWASFSIWGWAGGSPLHTLASSILVPENDSFNFSFFLGFRSQAPGVQSEAASGISLPHFGRAGGQEGRWSNCTMTDYANPPGASHQSQRWERNAAHLRISLRRVVPVWSIPPVGMTSEQLRVLESLGVD